jgi:hypothetical protein
VVPRRRASRLACASKPSSKRTVVRICQSVFIVCLYVNQQPGWGAPGH